MKSLRNKLLTGVAITSLALGSLLYTGCGTSRPVLDKQSPIEKGVKPKIKKYEFSFLNSKGIDYSIRDEGFKDYKAGTDSKIERNIKGILAIYSEMKTGDEMVWTDSTKIINFNPIYDKKSLDFKAKKSRKARKNKTRTLTQNDYKINWKEHSEEVKIGRINYLQFDVNNSIVLVELDHKGKLKADVFVNPETANVSIQSNSGICGVYMAKPNEVKETSSTQSTSDQRTTTNQRNTTSDQTMQSQGKRYSYVVKSGQNLTNIANMLGVSVKILVNLNNIENPDDIYPGQKLTYKIVPNK